MKIALIGFGYWGNNLFRSFSQHPDFTLEAVAEHNTALHGAIRQRDARVKIKTDALAVLDDPEIEAVAIATPVATHYELAREALSKGKHVLVEKPMCGNAEHAADLVALARRNDRTLMVDHTYLYHPAVTKLHELVGAGALGTVSYYESQRVNLGLFQPDVNVLWDLAPHDLSIIDHLFHEEPIHVEGSGYCHVNPTLPDICYVTLHYRSHMVAHLNLSWMSPVKVRRTAVGGSAKMVVWDDLDRDEPLKIYDSGINLLPQGERSVIVPSYRIGDVSSPRLSNKEPLMEVIGHFGRVIRGEEASRMDGEKGLRVVRTLERIQRALDRSLADVQRLDPAQNS